MRISTNVQLQIGDDKVFLLTRSANQDWCLNIAESEPFSNISCNIIKAKYLKHTSHSTYLLNSKILIFKFFTISVTTMSLKIDAYI